MEATRVVGREAAVSREEAAQVALVTAAAKPELAGG
jgi:hypothetical protein